MLFSLASIESLSTTGVYEEVILGSFPKEGPPYKSLWIPFDKVTWILLVSSFIIVSLVLFIIEKKWDKTTTKGGNLKKDGMYSKA